MTEIDLTKTTGRTGPTPVRPRTVLDAVTAGREPRPPLDTSAPLLPDWARSWDAVRQTTRRAAVRTGYRVGRFLVHLPALVALLVLYSPRGLGRLVAVLGRWIYDSDTAQLRHEHAGRGETPEAVKAQSMRRANLHARWIVAACVALPVVVPVLAWTAPAVLAVVVGLAVFVLVVKLIPGRGWQECVGAAVAAAVAWWYTPQVAALVPPPPAWLFAVSFPAGVLALGWLGRPRGRSLAPAGRYAPSPELVKPTAEMVVDALVASVPGVTDKNRDQVRVVAPGVATSAHGYTVELELPPGITAEMVVGRRGPLAGALRRDLGCVWPSGNEDRHPGYLRLFLSHRPMNKAKQPPWPLMAGKPVDIFEPMPLFTDEQMRWVALTIAGTPHLAVGGASGFGKSVWLRQLSCGVALDLRVRIVVIDGKRSGDLDHLRKLAHAFHEGADPEDVAAVVAELEGLVAEYLRRSKFLSNLPPEERSPKVTSALASRYPEDLSPIVVFYDEVQEGTQYGVKSNREDKAIRDQITGLLTRLSRVGRSAGIFLVLASQRPEADVIPSSIMGNCSIRVAFKVSDQVHNDQILGTSARRNGVDATMFGSRDKGMAWLKGGDDVDAQVVRSWSEMVDVGLAVELADKAYELRKARGLLTGQAAGDVEDTAVEVDLLDDLRDVMDHPPVPAMHLGELREALALLRPGTWGHLDNDALGAMLRQAGVEPRTVWSRSANKSNKGIKREWLDGDGGTAHPIAGA